MTRKLPVTWLLSLALAAVAVALVWLLVPRSSALVLTTEEQAWLRDHPRIRLAPDPNFPPIEFFDDTGRYSGLVADYYGLIEARLGIRFEVVRAATWDDVLRMARNREVDVVGAAQRTAARSEYLLFGPTILDVPNVIITRTDVAGGMDFADMAGKTVAVTQGNALEEYLRIRFPAIRVHAVPDDLAALREVSFGRVDATVVNLAIASHLIEKHGIVNLRVAGDSGRSNALHIATRSDWPILSRILTKALESIPESERDEAARYWIRLEGEEYRVLSRDLLVGALAVAGLLLLSALGVLAWNRALQRQVAERTAALETSEENYRQVFNAANDAIFLHDAETGVLLDVNERMLEMYGVTREQVLGSTADALGDGQPPYSHKEALEWITKAVTEGPQVFEWLARRSNGESFWVEVALRAATISGHLRVLAVVRDITERKRMEMALRELNESLERRVEEAVSANLEQERMLIQQSRLAAMGEMIGNIAHQWRQPINALNLLLTNIKEAHDHGELNEQELARLAEKGDRLIQKMSHTIDDFRNFFRPNKEKERFLLAHAIEATLSIVSASLEHGGIAVEVVGDRTLAAWGYPNEFSQVLLNLINNAREAIQARGGEGGRIVIRLGVEGDGLTITVRDNGGGVPGEVLPRVFEPYFTTKERGTGIGLYMSRMIVEHMGGTLSLRNVEGGAEAVIRLPLAQETGGA